MFTAHPGGCEPGPPRSTALFKGQGEQLLQEIEGEKPGVCNRTPGAGLGLREGWAVCAASARGPRIGRRARRAPGVLDGLRSGVPSSYCSVPWGPHPQSYLPFLPSLLFLVQAHGPQDSRELSSESSELGPGLSYGTHQNPPRWV